MTAAQQAKLLGQEISVRCESLLVTCTIVDIKQAYGRMRFQVAPVNGSGSIWVEDSRISGIAWDLVQEAIDRANGHA